MELRETEKNLLEAVSQFLNTSTCVNCGKCIKVCPTHIFELKAKVLPMNEDNCIQCRPYADNAPYRQSLSRIVPEWIKDSVQGIFLE